MSPDTSCRKCGTPMAPLKKVGNFTDAMVITAFRCDKCGHWNDLKRRKPKPKN